VGALRGATSVGTNERDAIVVATAELLREMLARNGLGPDDVISVFFTATHDLTAAFPAAAARALGLSEAALMCAAEIDVPGALRRCVRVLAHVHTSRRQAELEHVYLGDARRLRSDLEAPDE